MKLAGNRAIHLNTRKYISDDDSMTKIERFITSTKMDGRDDESCGTNNTLLLEQFARQSQTCADCDDKIAPNICPNCLIPMDTQGNEYVCGQCKCIAAHTESYMASEFMQYGCRDLRRHYGSSDPLGAQRVGVYENLITRRETYLKVVAERRGIPYVANSAMVDSARDLSALAPSTHILINVAKIYNEIQRKALTKGAPFIRRGDVKNEILAAILFVECGKSEQRSKKEIAEMMGLRTEGFSRGYEQLLLQSADGNVTLDSDEEICEHKISYYYERTIGAYIVARYNAPGGATELLRDVLNSYNLKFIRCIIRNALKHHIGVQSQLQSKIVGTIWFLICTMRYPLTTQYLDARSGGIKKGTFLKFSHTIAKSARLRHIAKNYFAHLRAKGAIAQLAL